MTSKSYRAAVLAFRAYIATGEDARADGPMAWAAEDLEADFDPLAAGASLPAAVRIRRLRAFTRSQAERMVFQGA